MTVTSQTLTKFIVGAAATAAVLFVVWYFSSIVAYILVSAVLAVIGCRFVGMLVRLRIGGRAVPRWLAALVTLLLFWAVFAAICSLFVPLVINKLYQLSTLDFRAVVASVEEPIVRAQNYLDTIFDIPGSEFSMPEAISSTLREVVNVDSVNTLFSSALGITFSSLIAFFSISFITFFFMKDDGLFYSMVTAVFPARYAQSVTRALDSVTVLLSRYFMGIFTESVLLMTAVSLVMIAFGMAAGDAFFIGLIMGVMNVVPYAGPLIGGSLSVCLGVVTPIPGFTAGHTMLVIACSLLVRKGLDDFVIQPSLYSNRVRAHPLEIFIVILIAGTLGGIVGMLLAIPSYTVLRVFAKEFFSQYRLVRQLTEKI